MNIDKDTIKLIISICSLIVSVLTLCGFGVYMSLHTKKRFEKREKEKQDAEELKRKAYLDTLTQIISAQLSKEITPLRKDLSEIKENLALNTEGTVTILRNDMKKSLDFYKEKGYATAGDRANWMELYNTYAKLGGNHFREYVDAWKQELEALPLKKKEKKTLVENKQKTRKEK